MSESRRRWAIVLLFGLATSPLSAAMATRRFGKGPQAGPAKESKGTLPVGYAVPVEAGPELDGKLADPCWAKAPAMALRRTLDGSGPAAHPTEVRAVQDGKTLWLAFRCVEPALDKLRATRRSHDGEIWADDSVEIFLGFGGTYYHFGVNAAGSTYDGKGKDPAWNSGCSAAVASPGTGSPFALERGACPPVQIKGQAPSPKAEKEPVPAAVARGEGEWTAELAIPLEKMLDAGKSPAEWIANFNRSRYAGGQVQESAWSPTYSGNSHAPEWFGKLLFSAPPAESASAPTSPTDTVKVLPTKAGLSVVQFELSALPKGAAIYRAELRVARTQAVTGADDEAMVDIEIYPRMTPRGGQAPFPERGGLAPSPLGEKVPVPVSGQEGDRHPVRGRTGSQSPEGEPLKVQAPWFDCFDATEAVRAACRVPRARAAEFLVKACPFWDAAATCLDVAYEGEPADVPRQAADVQAFHRAGQTFITWKEIDDPVAQASSLWATGKMPVPPTDQIKWGQFRSILEAAEKSGLRYAVYRSDKPLTAATLHEAQRIALVAPLSGWNANGRSLDQAIDDALSSQETLFYGQWNPFAQASMDGKYGLDCPMERLVVKDGGPPLPRGTGLYVHTPGKAGKAFYAVLTYRDGVENTADLSEKNCLASAVEEAAGIGEPVLQKAFPPEPSFNYREKRLHYVQWVAPPYSHLPSQYYNWGVGVPETGGGLAPSPVWEKVPVPVSGEEGDRHPVRGRTGSQSPRAIELSLHRDGRSYARTQYRVETDSLVLSPHDFPIGTWWYGHHESLGTLKSFKQGVVQPYTERRLLAFMDWAAKKWPVDRSRVLVTGAGGGAAGSGAMHLGIRHPKVFSLVLSGYGLADYAGEIEALTAVKRLGTMGHELESIWGKVAWGCKTDTGQSVWDELNLTRVVAEVPEKVNLPLVTVTGGGMLKPMRDFFVAMLEAGQPIMGRYGVYGGGLLLPVSRTGNWTNMIRQDVRLDQAMPAFSGPGTGGLWQRPKEPTGELVVSDGIQRWWGENMNTACRWKTDDLVDEPVRFEITLFLAGAPSERALADVTLRRLQKFRIRAGYEYRFEILRPTGEKMREGTVQPGKGGQFVLKGVALTPEGTRIVLRP